MSAIYEDIIPYINYFVNRKCMPTWSLYPEMINFHDLTYVYEGKATYIIDGKPYELEKGDLIYAPGGSIREAYTYPDNPMSCYAFNFQVCSLYGESISLPFSVYTRIGINTDLINLYKDFNCLWLEKSTGYMLKARAVFMLILYELIKQAVSDRRQIRTDSRIKKVKEYILLHYFEEIKLEMLAESVDLNPVYFGTFFKNHTGYSVKEYINLIRIRKARDLLSTGGYKVGEAAFLCGYNDIYYFSKVFKKITGVSPIYFVGNNGGIEEYE